MLRFLPACLALPGLLAIASPKPDAAMPDASATPAHPAEAHAVEAHAVEGHAVEGHAVEGDALEAHDPRHDFDFLDGRWFARSRRLTRPLDPAADEWEAFDSVHDGVRLPGGFGVADDFRIPSRPDFVGLALQLYDATTGQWQAYWYRNGVLTASLLGRFAGGVGTFEGPDTHEGRPIRTRYIWSRITPRSARWEQAYSADGGRTWETNWVMDYRRVEAE